jgi:flagellar biogenesis protein FliO
MDWTSQLFAISFVFLLLGASVYVLGRRNGSFRFLDRLRRPSRPQSLCCTARLPLTAQHTIHIVELQGRAIVVATFPGGVAFEPQPAAFSSVLGQALGSGEGRQ